VLAPAVATYALQQALVAPALPDLQRDLGVSPAAAGWVFTSYLLSAAAATPIGGRLGDIHGKRRVLLWTLAIVVAATALAAVAPSLEVLIVARAIQGMGGALFPLSFALLREHLPPARVASGIALVSALLGVGAAAGVVLAGLVVEALSWQWLFWLPCIATAGCLLAAYRIVPESERRAPAGVDWGSGVLISSGLAAVLIAVTQSTTWGWASGRTLGIAAVGAALLVAWAARERRSPHPLVDMAMMRHRGVWTTNIVAFLTGAGIYAAFLLIPQLVQVPRSTGYGLGASVAAAGLFLAPMTVLQLVSAPLSGRLASRHGAKVPMLAGAVVTLGGVLLLIAAHAASWQVYLSSAVLGMGVGLVMAAMANLIIESVAPEQTGVATGMNTVLRWVGGAVGAQVTATLVAAQLDRLGRPLEAGWTAAFAAAALALLAAVAVAAAAPRPGWRRRSSVAAP
jgi:EmrB/QacA subfamily drug resistance transporter